MRLTDEEFLAIAADNGAGTGRGSESRLEWVDFHSYAEFNAFARAIYRMGQEEMRERAAQIVDGIHSAEDQADAIRALEVEP